MKRDNTPHSLSETDSPARILIVDDEDDICEIVAFHLERIGLRTTSASSAEEALRLMQAEDDPHYFSLICYTASPSAGTTTSPSPSPSRSWSPVSRASSTAPLLPSMSR